jgi:hypothetical protein
VASAPGAARRCSYRGSVGIGRVRDALETRTDSPTAGGEQGGDVRRALSARGPAISGIRDPFRVGVELASVARSTSASATVRAATSCVRMFGRYATPFVP